MRDRDGSVWFQVGQGIGGALVAFIFIMIGGFGLYGTVWMWALGVLYQMGALS